MNELEERVFGPLPDETWVYPGHGDDTTLEKERRDLEEWRGEADCLDRYVCHAVARRSTPCVPWCGEPA